MALKHSRQRRVLSQLAALALGAALIAGCSSAVSGAPIGPGSADGGEASGETAAATDVTGDASSSDSADPGASTAPDGGSTAGATTGIEPAADPEPGPDGAGPGSIPDATEGTWAGSSLDQRHLLPAENVSTTWDVAVKEDAVILGYEAAEEVLIDYDVAAGRWEFKSGAAAAAGLREGDALLVAGRGIGRITSIVEEGGSTVVTTGEASLADVIEEGTMAWDATVGFGEQWLTDSAPQGLRSPHLVGIYTVDRSGALHEARPRVGPLGKLAKSTVDQNSLAGNLKLSIAAAGGGKKEFDFTVPGMMFKYLIPIGPVPLTLTVSAQVIGSVQAMNKASATFTASFSYSADAGFSYDGTDVKTTGVFNVLNMDPDAADPAAMIGNVVDAQFGVGFPRVSLSFFDIGFVPYVQPGLVVGTSLH